MANSARGEADLTIGGKTYRVGMSMGALAEMAGALEVGSLPELHERILKFNLADMPKVIMAVLKGNGHDVDPQLIAQMDWKDYFDHVIPAFFRTDAEKQNGSGEAQPAHPRKRQKA